MECLICFHQIKKKEYYQCVYCNTVVHETCYSNWWGTNGDDNNCIHCRQENGLVLRNKVKKYVSENSALEGSRHRKCLLVFGLASKVALC